MNIQSSSFESGGRIPQRHSGEGENLSPPLSWKGVPAGAVELALIVDDPDAPSPQPWVHWVACKVSPASSGFTENVQVGLVQGRNDFGKMGYGGPKPPKGHGEHRYFFRLYALDRAVTARPGISKPELLGEMKGHILEECELVGTYEIK